MEQRSAQCSCGQLRVHVSGEPLRVSMCHCLACQRRTGSTYGVQARFPLERVRSTGRSSEYVRTAESGHTLRFHFCPDCGATVHYSLQQFPDVIAIAVGAFADPAFPAPRFSVYEACMHPWVATPPDAQHQT